MKVHEFYSFKNGIKFEYLRIKFAACIKGSDLMDVLALVTTVTDHQRDQHMLNNQNSSTIRSTKPKAIHTEKKRSQNNYDNLRKRGYLEPLDGGVGRGQARRRCKIVSTRHAEAWSGPSFT